VELLRQRGASDVHAAATHGIFAAPALDLIERAPMSRVLVTDTVPMPADGPRGKIEVITVAPFLAEAITRIHKDLSISALFT
jgi:ribose-phosphate pyrophosphokinase